MKSRKVLLQVLLRTAALPAGLMLGTLAIAQTSGGTQTGTQKPRASGGTVQSPATTGQSTTHPGHAAGGGSFSQSGTSGAINDAGRMARFESHLSSIKSALQLTSEQERLWPAAESAMREAFRKQQEERERMRNASSAGSNDFVERMRQRAEMMTSRGEAMKRVADAIQPLHDSLTSDQKRRVASLMRDHMRGHMADRDDRGYRGGMHHDRGGMGQGRGSHMGPHMGYGRQGEYGGGYGGWRGQNGDRGQYGYQQGYRGGRAWQRDNEDGFNLYDPNWRSRSYDYDRGSREDWRGRSWQGQGYQGQSQGWRRNYDDDSYRGYGSQDRGRYGRYGDDEDRRGCGSRWREEDRRGRQYDNDNTDNDDHDHEN
jgi:zinc resistance-associated protein